MDQVVNHDLESNLLPNSSESSPSDLQQPLSGNSPYQLDNVAIVVHGVTPWEFSGKYNLLIAFLYIIKIAAFVVSFMSFSCVGVEGVWMIFMTIFEIYALILTTIRLIAIYRINKALSNVARCLKANVKRAQKQREDRRYGIVEGNQQPRSENLTDNIFYHNSRIIQFRMTFFIVRGILGLYNGIWPILMIWGVIAYGVGKSNSCSSDVSNYVMLAFLSLGTLWLAGPLLYKGFGCILHPILSFGLKMIFSGSKDSHPPEVDLTNVLVTNYTPVIHTRRDCSICNVEYNNGDRIVQLDCNSTHYFHEACGKRWLRATGQCPICQTDIHRRNQNGPVY